MRWDDERYVRLYAPRNDGDWDMWPWQARALFPLMLRKADRIGVIKCGRHGVRALAHMVGLPVDHVEVGLAALLEDGCVQEPQPHVLFIRNYLVAQEAAQTDRARKEAQRERERDRVAAEVEGLIGGVTNRDAESQSVTDGHETGEEVTAGHGESQVVTPGRAVPCRTVDLAAGAATAGAEGDVQPDATPARRAAKVRKPRPLADKTPLPFRASDACAEVEKHAAGRFMAPSPLERGHAIRLEQVIRAQPDLRQWAEMGKWFAAGGPPDRRGLIDIRTFATMAGGWFPFVAGWCKAGRKPVVPEPRPAFTREAPPAPRAPIPDFVPAPRPNIPDDPEERRRLREDAMRQAEAESKGAA